MYSEKKEGIKVEGIHNQGQGGFNHRYKENKYMQYKGGDKQLPFLVRTFWKINEDITIDQLEFDRIQLLKDHEISLYLYLNTTLRDIVDQLKYQIDGVYRKDTKFKLYNIYLDQYGVLKKKAISIIHSVKSHKEDDSMLRDYGFKVGDFLIIEVEGKYIPPHQS